MRRPNEHKGYPETSKLDQQDFLKRLTEILYIVDYKFCLNELKSSKDFTITQKYNVKSFFPQ